MKQKLLTFLIMAFIPIAMMAYDVEVDGIYYKLSPRTSLKTATVTSGDDLYSGRVEIPESIIHNGEIYSVTGIGEWAFDSCSDLLSIYIPSTVISIAVTAFKDCSNLTSMEIDDNNTVYESDDSNTAIIESATNTLIVGCNNTIIPKDVTCIGSYAFSGRNTMTSINIPSGVTSIGGYAFQGCTNLASVNIPDGVTSIGCYAFHECPSITTINIPYGVSNIREGAFSGCTSLTSISIPESVTEITCIDYGDQSGAFFGCTSLTSITIPNSVTCLWNSSFEGCTSLTTIDLGTGLGTMLSYDTYEENIRNRAFAECPNIELVICRAIPTEKNEFGEQGLTVSGAAFDNSYIEHAKLLVPHDYLEYFQNTAPWSSFGTIEELPQNSVIIADDCEREYGEPNPNPWPYTVMGPAISGDPAITCSATETSAPGTYTITVSAGTVTDPNATFNNGTLTITEAPLTIKAKSYTIWKGDPLPAQFEIEYTGFKNNETEADLTTPPTISCAATDSKTPGSYDITVSGAISTNYSITEEGGMLNIREKENMANDGNGIFMPWGQNTPWQMTYVYQSQDTNTSPDADWYKTSFDDSEWDLMTGPVDRSSSPHFGLGNYFDVPDEGCALYLRRTFDIDATEYANMPDPLIMKFTVDDRVDVYLNDKFLGSNHQGDGTDNFDYTLTIDKSDFVTGTNVLALYYHDGCAEAYLDYQLMSFDPSTVSPYTDNQGITYELDGTQTAWTVTSMNWNESQTSIDIPGSLFGLPVTTIAYSVFNGHNYITSITLNEGLTTIGNVALANTGITSIHIPSTVTDIKMWNNDDGCPDGAFDGCSSLTTITVDANNSVYSSPTGSNAIIEISTNTIVVGCKNTQIPSSVTAIGTSAFAYNTSLTEFTIPATVTSIGEGAFQYCSNMATVTVESSTPLDISSQSCPPFEGTKKFTLWVPQGSKSTYQNEPGWSEFKFIFEIGETPVYPDDGYAYFDASTGTFTFVYDDQYMSRTGVNVFFLDEPNGDPLWWSDGTCNNVTDVVFDPSFANARPISTHSWLREMPLNSITGLKYVNTSQVVSMNAMFMYTSSITELDLSTFDVSNVTDMEYMFYGCSGLTKLTLPVGMSVLSNYNYTCEGVGNYGSNPCMLKVPAGFNFNGVDTSGDSFCWAGGYFTMNREAYAELATDGTLTLYYDGDRDNRTGTTYDFNGSYTSSSATSVVIDPSFAGYIPTSTAQWFKGMSALTSISGIENITTYNVSDMSEMFSGCSSLTSLDMGNFDISSANGNTSQMFYGCSSLTQFFVSESMGDLASDAFNGVGTTASPCMLNVPENFNFNGTDTSGDYFQWMGGYFKLVTETTINISSSGFTTYCSSRDLDFSEMANLRAYVITGYDWANNKVFTTRVYDVPAGTGIFVVGKEGDYNVNFKGSSCRYTNMLVGTFSPISISSTDGDYTNLTITSKGTFSAAEDGESVDANRAWLQVPTDQYNGQPVEIDYSIEGDMDKDHKVSLIDVMRVVDIILNQ